MHPMLNIAIKAARRAGAVINRAVLEVDRIVAVEKAPRDYVTEHDRAAQDAIIDVLQTAFPTHFFLAEESDLAQGSLTDYADKPYVWVIDPIDGTNNFIRGLPSFAISIALMEHGHITLAVIYDPSLNELFTACRGEGATLNDRRIRTSKRTKLTEGLFAYCAAGLATHERTTLHQVLQTLESSSDGYRSNGSAALSLAYVAAGRFDGFFATGLKPWDFAAGALLILEAGGLITDFKGNSEWMSLGQIVAAGNKILPPLLKVVEPLQ